MPEASNEREPAEPKATRRGVSRGVVVLLAVLLPLLLVGMWYSETILAAIQLERWSDAGPRAAVERLHEAVRAGDRQAIEALAMPGAKVAITEADGGIRGLKVGDSMRPPTLVAPLAGASIRVTRIEYQFVARTVEVTVEGDEGYRAVLTLQRPGGSWRVANLVGPGA